MIEIRTYVYETSSFTFQNPKIIVSLLEFLPRSGGIDVGFGKDGGFRIEMDGNVITTRL